MPVIQKDPRKIGDLSVTEFVDSVGTSSVTYTLKDTSVPQDTLKIQNTGPNDLTVTVGGQSNVTVSAYKEKIFSESFTSFTLQGVGGNASFRAVSSYLGYNEEGEDRLAVSLADIANVFITLKDFNPKLNDSTFDNISVINNAINYLKNTYGGGTLVIPNGTYYIAPNYTDGNNFNAIKPTGNIRIVGSGKTVLKVKPNAGNYAYVVFPTASSPNDWNVIENITIDANIQNNTTCDIKSGEGDGQIAIRAASGSLRIHQCRVLNFGGRACFASYAGSSDTTQIATENYIEYVRGRSTLANGWYDTSVIVFSYGRTIVERNKIIMINGVTDQVNTGIEIGSPIAHVSENHVKNTRTGILVYTTDYTGYNPLVQSQVIENNKIEDVNNGVSIYETSKEIRNLTIKNNGISLITKDFNLTGNWGIGITTGNLDYYVKNLQILNNSIVFNFDDRNTLGLFSASAGISLTHAAGGSSKIIGTKIKGNYIENSPVAALIVNSGSVGHIEDVLIEENVTYNCCANPNFTDDGSNSLVFISGGTRIRIAKNTWKDDRPSTSLKTKYILNIASLGTNVTNLMYEFRTNNVIFSNGSPGFNPSLRTISANRKYSDEPNIKYVWDTTTGKNKFFLNDIIFTNGGIKQQLVNAGVYGTDLSGITGSITNGTSVLTVSDGSSIEADDALKVDTVTPYYANVKCRIGNTLYMATNATADKTNVNVGYYQANISAYTV